jgi:hypothetical protein
MVDQSLFSYPCLIPSLPSTLEDKRNIKPESLIVKNLGVKFSTLYYSADLLVINQVFNDDEF